MSLDFPFLIDTTPSQKFASLTSASRVAKQVQEASGNQQDVVISKIMQILSNVSLFAQQVHESSETYNQLQAGSFDEAGALFYLQTPERIAFVLDFLAKDDFWDPQAISIELEQNPDLLNQLDAMTLHIDLSHDSQNMHRLIKFFRDLDPKNSSDWKRAQSLYTLYSYFNEKPPVELIEVIGEFWDQAFHASIDNGEFDQFAKTLKTHECFSKISDLKDDEVEFFNQLKPFWNNLTSLSFHFSVNNGTVLSILKEMPAVIGLSFSHRELTNELIELVCRLKKLKDLTLVETKFDDSILFKIVKSIQLKKLSLDYHLNHSFLKQIPWDIEELDVYLSDVNSGSLADSLSRFIHIRKLSLNFLEKNINFVGIPHLPKLEELKLKSSHVSGSTILGGLVLLNTDLKRLNIENIKFSSLNQLVLPDQFNRLEELDLNGSDPVLVEQIMDRLAIPSVIKKLNLENTHCEMTDQLAFNIGLLTSLEELNILSINKPKWNVTESFLTRSFFDLN